LIEILKKSGQYENTLIIYISDNGVAFPGAKTTLYDSGMKLPCIIRTPGRTRGGVTQDAMITWADIMPTLLDVAGIGLKNYEMDGRSFRAGLDGSQMKGWDEVFASHTFHQITMYYPMRVVRTREYKLIHNLASGLTFPSARDLIQSPTWISAVREGGTVFGRRTIAQYLHRPEFELYDLRKDPDEVVNLSDDPSAQTVKAALIEKLKAYQTATKDPWISKWNYE
jgi:N-sulfoglucosamine sulfohydrolase